VTFPIDVRKAYRLLGYKSTVSFEEGIRKTVEWFKLAYGIPTGKADSSRLPNATIATPRINDYPLDVGGTMHSPSSDDSATLPDASLDVTAIVERWTPIINYQMPQVYMPMLQWLTVLCLCFCYELSKNYRLKLRCTKQTSTDCQITRRWLPVRWQYRFKQTLNLVFCLLFYVALCPLTS